MRNFYATLAIRMAFRITLYIVLISVLIAWWSTPWVYAAAILAIPSAIEDAQSIRSNIKKIETLLTSIEEMQCVACDESDYYTRKMHERELSFLRSRYNVTLAETQRLLTQVKVLAERATVYKAQIESILLTERYNQHSRHTRDVTFFTPSRKIDQVVDQILAIPALKKPRFLRASPEHQKQVIRAFCKAFSVGHAEAQNTIYNHVMGRLSRHPQKPRF